jgi:adenylate cyclase
VLKLIGDGVLAVFPLQGGATREDVCVGALAAAGRARGAVANLNGRRARLGQPPLDFVAVLHLGPLAYGNVGARERLEFTVLGPAVNVTSRLEALAKRIGEKTLLTAEVAAHAPRPTRRLGSFAL